MFHSDAPQLEAAYMEREARKPSHVSRFRRLREAIAEHNWFNVAIEILIVTVGILLACTAVGAFLAGLFSGPLGSVRRQGTAVVVSVMGWGASIGAFGAVVLVCVLH